MYTTTQRINMMRRITTRKVEKEDDFGFQEHLPVVGVNDLAHPDAEGYLEKKRKDKKFRSEKLQKRWCVIHGGNFYYFNKCNDLKQKGGFSLKGYSFRKQGDLSFAIVCQGKRCYEFVAPSKDEAEKFRKAIMDGNPTRGKLTKSDSFPGVETSAPVSPTRDRSISIPTDKKSYQMTYKSKSRSHTPEPFQRSPDTNSRERSSTLDRSAVGKTRTNSRTNQLKKTQSSPYVDRSSRQKQKPQVTTGKQNSIDDHDYANVGVSRSTVQPPLGGGRSNENLKDQEQFSSSDDSDSDYDVPMAAPPRHKVVEQIVSKSKQEEKRKTSPIKKQVSTTRLKSQGSVNSEDSDDYDYPGEVLIRPESDYDSVENLRRKRSESCDTQCAEVDDGYIDASKLASLPKPNMKPKPTKPSKPPCNLDPQQEEEDIYFEPIPGVAPVEQVSNLQIKNVLHDDDEDPYFIPIEEPVASKIDKPHSFQQNSDQNMSKFDDENPYFEPITDNDMTDVGEARLCYTSESNPSIAEIKSGRNDLYASVKDDTKMKNLKSDGYSNPDEVQSLKRKPPAPTTVATTKTKSNLFTDDADMYVNLPYATKENKEQPKHTGIQMELSQKLNARNTLKLQNMKLKNSMDDSNNSDSDDYEYSVI